ncbi:hypothetical protein BDR26DRAFT_851856 [Obelidium mucronatum]|nr:hypothetical protein BDR26DRAFT_851856 [Obelidium mucronatum]
MTAEVETVQQRALNLYSQASVFEREGRLGEALAKYRQATKLEPNIDRLARTNLPQLQQQMALADEGGNAGDDLQSLNYYSFGNVGESATAADAALAAGVASMSIAIQQNEEVSEKLDRRFKPKDETRPVVIAIFPSELITHIIRWSLVLDFSSLEQIASTCRYFQHQTLTAGLWRWLCHKYYARPAYSYNSVAISTQLAERYRNCWLTMWSEKPRVSFEGLYISRVNYIRQGYAESYQNPYLIVTYFRYLRLFRDGSMLIWTTTVEPTQALADLTNVMESPASTDSLKVAIGEAATKFKAREKAAALASLKGLLFGTWQLRDDGLIMDTIDGANNVHYEFSISSTRRAGHNKLTWIDFHHYKRTNPTEKTLITNTQRKPFVFSKVRSWKRKSF